MTTEPKANEKLDLSPDIKSRTNISLWKLSIIRYWFIAKDYEHECALNVWNCERIVHVPCIYKRCVYLFGEHTFCWIFFPVYLAGVESKQIKLYIATTASVWLINNLAGVMLVGLCGRQCFGVFCPKMYTFNRIFIRWKWDHLSRGVESMSMATVYCSCVVCWKS